MTSQTLALASLLCLPASLLAQDWPAFRGPKGDGTSPCTSAPLVWSKDKNVKWQAALPKPANGSPIVSKGRVFLTCPEDDQGKKRSLYCFDAEKGERLWARTVEIDKVLPTHATNPYCGSTPVADGERVVVWHASAGLACYDFEGKELWRRELGEFRHQWGYGSSPILHAGRVILHTGPGKQPFVMAVDLANGETLWRVEEPPPKAALVDDKRLVGSWCTPLVIAAGEGQQILCTQPTRLVAYDPKDGAALWWSSGLTCERGDLAYSSPVLAGELCVVYAGFEGPGIAVRLEGQGDVTETHRVWRREKQPSNVGSGVFAGGHVYHPDSNGFVACIDPKTGERLWSERAGKGQQWGSIVFAAGHLYLMNQRGTTIVFKPNHEKLEVVAENELDERTNSTPAIANGQIWLRTHQHLWCIAEPDGKPRG